MGEDDKVGGINIVSLVMVAMEDVDRALINTFV
jgi:hypothetical protein